MNFVYPLFLWGMALVAIPIIIHIFNFQRPRKVYFTNIEFLKEVKAVSNSRNRLRNILVLIARCLLIVALSLAFAQPFIPNKNATSKEALSRYVSIYLDNSFSMQNERNGRKLLESAIDFTNQILRNFPKSTLFALLDNSFYAGNDFFFEAPKIAEQVSRTDYSNASRDFASVYARQLGTLSRNTSDKYNHIFWISDFQKHSAGNLAQLPLDSTNNFYLIPLTPQETSNLFIDSVWLENPFVQVNENNTLLVKIRHHGSDGATDKLVKFFIDDKQVSGTTVSLDPGGSETIRLNFAVNESGTKACRISLDDYPVTFDNDYYFSFKVAPEIRIVHINGDKTPFVPKVYANEPFFQLSEFSTDAVDYSKTGNAHLVVLQSLRQIDSGLREVLRSVLSKGGAVLIFPSANPDLESYQNLTGLSLSVIPSAINSPVQTLAPPDAGQPFFAGVFEKISMNMAMPDARPLLTWTGAGQKLTEFRNGQPFLSELSVGGGKIYLCASPLDDSYSNFQRQALFVPVMYKIALLSRSTVQRLAFSFAEPVVTLPLEDASIYNRTDIFKLVSADSAMGETQELIPSQRLVGNQLVIELPKISMEAGNYNLVRRNDGFVAGMLSLNYDKQESVFESYTAAELSQIFAGKKNVQVFELSDAERFTSEFQARNVATPLWRYLIVAALVLLLIEILLIRFWKH
jgi:hypothetical protein